VKLARFDHARREAQGIVIGERVHVLEMGDAGCGFDLPGRAIAELDTLLARSPRSLLLREVMLLPPMAPYSQLICVGVNYADHAAETGHSPQRVPAVFLRHLRGVVGHGQPLCAPRGSPQYDYEGELALVIGRGGRHIAPADAMQHVAGYCCFMDGSVRDFQRESVAAGKNFPRSAALGPWIVTSDEVPDAGELQLQTRVNGRTVQSAPTSTMLHSLAQLVAYCSTWTELRAGDVIATGTPAGVGARHTPPTWLRPGDTIEVSVEGVGVLANPVEAER